MVPIENVIGRRVQLGPKAKQNLSQFHPEKYAEIVTGGSWEGKVVGRQAFMAEVYLDSDIMVHLDVDLLTFIREGA